VIAGLRDDGVTVVLTTHDLDEAERLADHVVIIDHGQVIAAGSPSELTSAGPPEVRFAAAPGLMVTELATHLGAPVHEGAPGEYLVAAEGTPALVAALTAWLADRDLTLGDLRAGRQRLEDVFVRLVDEHATAEPAEPRPRGRRGRGRRA
jgi:ABC-2 type transport system ATP-binding protein